MKIKCIQDFWSTGYREFQKGIFYGVVAMTTETLIVKNDMGENVSIPMRIVDDYFDCKTPQ